MWDSQVLAFIAVAAVLTVTPGSDTLLVLKNTLSGGQRAGLQTMWGILSGILVHALLSAIGLSVILTTSATAFQVVKVAGALYLIWLGVSTFRSGGMEAASDDAAQASTRAMYTFREGLFSNVLNPKVAVFYLAFLPQFISPGDPVVAKSILLATIHNVMGVVWLGTIATVAGRSRKLLTSGSIRKWLSRVSGAVLVGLGVRLALSER